MQRSFFYAAKGPMMRKPIIVADAIRANSLRSGLVHFFTRWIESCVCDKCVLRDASRDGATRRARPGNARFRRSATTLTNCLKGWTITALTSDMVAALSGRCGSLSLSVSLRQLHNQRSYGFEAYSVSIYSSSGLLRSARDDQRTHSWLNSHAAQAS